MNFEVFEIFYRNAQYDEIKVIGRDVEKDGRDYHILGMTRKEKKVVLSILEMVDPWSEQEPYREKTPRESLKDSMESQRKESYFLHTRELQCGDRSYETAGASSGPLRNSDYCEAYMLFIKMLEAGWKLPKDSPFYEVSWECLAITAIELRDEYETLPDWSDEMQVLVDRMPGSHAIEIPVLLECDKTLDLTFEMSDGSQAVCYINKIYTVDMWEEQERRFADPAYRERMLQHVSEAELEQMKEQFFKTLAEHCPKGQCYMAVEYECNKDVTLTFHDREYLDTIKKSKGGSASALLVNLKPDTEKGTHGLKLRGCMIQKPLDRGTKALEAELFSYSEMVQKKVEEL